MSASDRNTILYSVRRSLGRSGPVDDGTAAKLRARIAGHARNIVPARTDLDDAGLVDLFQTMAEKVFATVERVSDMSEVPGAVGDYLRRENLPAQVVMAPDETLDAAPWSDNALMDIRRGTPVEADQVSVTSAPVAVAETGTLAMFSGPAHPSTLNFIPETHVVVLPASRVVKSYEDVFDAVRAQMGDAESGRNGLPPRTVNFITGPSRSGDIEQTLLLGAHGPRRLHIVIVEDGEQDAPKTDDPMTGGSQDDEAELFRRVLADAEPLKRKRPVAKKAAARKDDAPQAVLRKSPRRPAPIIRPPELPTLPPPVAANDFSRMDRRTADRFRRGKLPIEARLDLHGHYQDAAHHALNEFIADSAAADRRMVLVITGRGSREGSGVLRARLPQWLNQPPCRDRVLAFTAARPEHGGDGAFYVLLKRNRDRRA